MGAKYIGWADRVASIQPGRYGDIIAVRGDPLDDTTRLQDVAMGVKGGNVYRTPYIK